MAIDRAQEDTLLELLNTTAVVEGSTRDALGTRSAGRAWVRQHGGSGASDELSCLIAARDALQEVVRGGREAACLGEFLQGVSSVPDISGGKLEWSLQVPATRRMAVESVLTWATLQETKPGRLRPCANPQCRRFLLDRSKPNSARWCSMAECGNRMKARRHYQRVKEAQNS
ncbi:CGNR zinc finger domain-containing protein [Streptomyces sp. NPDC002012]|uniref:CGNR zinc finger domain-containing protein n=1 Tax=unclassified Streptomyces TaxID=2593676 RepID=UPI00331DED2A